MLSKKIVLFLLFFLLTGCTSQSTFVNVNIPIDELESSTIIEDTTNDLINEGVNNNENNEPITEDENPVDYNNEPITQNDDPVDVVPVTVEIPNKLELDVDFAPQAPFGNWNELHEEACEEASMAIVAYYFLNQPMNEAVMESEIAKLNAWEIERGYKIDLSANQTAQILRDYYKLSARVVDEVTVDRIKYELSRGNLIIVPAAGRELENPYFRYPGPIYHMLVIKGYDNDEFITNEVGTKRGDGFKYKYQKLIGAVHDWNPSWSHYDVTDEQIGSQPKRMIVVSK